MCAILATFCHTLCPCIVAKELLATLIFCCNFNSCSFFSPPCALPTASHALPILIFGTYKVCECAIIPMSSTFILYSPTIFAYFSIFPLLFLKVCPPVSSCFIAPSLKYFMKYSLYATLHALLAHPRTFSD